jgi:hypothetical protein
MFNKIKFREACVRCALLRPDHGQRLRLVEIRDNPEARILWGRLIRFFGDQ